MDQSRPSLAVLSHSLLAEDADLPPNARLYLLPPTPIDYAAAFYRTLRQADSGHNFIIAIHRPPLPQHSESPEAAAIWRAVHDRLTRACAPR
ncbi:MAG: Sua5 family C-terminal domain-containing protein [Phycisphaerales bacterium]